MAWRVMEVVDEENLPLLVLRVPLTLSLPIQRSCLYVGVEIDRKHIIIIFTNFSCLGITRLDVGVRGFYIQIVCAARDFEECTHSGLPVCVDASNVEIDGVVIFSDTHVLEVADAGLPVEEVDANLKRSGITAA